MVQLNTYIIIYLDLVGYSKKNETIQISLFKQLQKEIYVALSNEIEMENTILIPTGDGMIVSIKEYSSTTYLKALEFITHIYAWEKKCNEKIRSSIHVGDINIIKDINGNENMVGHAINNASRILSGAEDGSIVISKEFYEKYLQTFDSDLNTIIHINDIFSFKLLDEDSVIDKHGYEHFIYSIVLYKENVAYGIESQILNKYFTNIYSTEYPKKENFYNSFIEKIKYCDSLTLFGIYHPSTINILKNIDTNANKEIHVDIFYASDILLDEIKNFFKTNIDELNIKSKKQSLQDITTWYIEHPNKKNIKLRIFEYQIFYPFGFSIINGNIPKKGFIHFSNYILGILPEHTPYVEVEWKTNNMPPIYKFYHDYINSHVVKQKNIIELDLMKGRENE